MFILVVLEFMKIAIVQDELVRRGGAEQVTLSFHKAFPDAPIYTLSYNPENTYPEFKTCDIKTSWFGKYIKHEDNVKRLFFPLGIIAMKQLYLKGYDVVLQSTTHCAKYVKTTPGTLVITYCHTPFRLAWRPDSYEQVREAGFLKKKLYNAVTGILRKVDRASAAKSDWFLTNALGVVPRIKKAYNPEKDVTVINPPVKCRNFYVSESPGDYYLVVSRFEPYKKVDLAVQAFNRLPEKKLIIVGKGSMESSLKKMAGDNITFLSGVSTAELSRLYAECKALIFPQLEDYGITPLEANASGRPVIAYGEGGVNDTMIPLNGDPAKATSVFFKEQTVDALLKAIRRFEELTFDPVFIRSHAESFDEQQFVDKIKAFVADKYQML